MRLQQVGRFAIYASVLICFLCFTFVPKAITCSASDLLTVQIKATTIKGESIDQVIGHLIEYGIPIGIDLGNENLTPPRTFDLDLPQTTVKHFLDSVIAKDPRYTWKLEGGVVHVWPVKARDALVATLLDTKIGHFSFTGGVSRYQIQNEIMDLPEISSQLIVAGVGPLMIHNFDNMAKLEARTFFEESNVSLRELLDRIVLKTDIKAWVIIRWGKNSEYITLKS
jgi:hypothetical protein